MSWLKTLPNLHHKIPTFPDLQSTKIQIHFCPFSIYLLQLFQFNPSLCHMWATPLFFPLFFHLKQVQYATTPSNLDSLEGRAGEGRWVGVWKEGVWRRREEKQVMSSKEPLPCTGFSISYAWLCVFSPMVVSFSSGRVSGCGAFALLQVLCLVSVH